MKNNLGSDGNIAYKLFIITLQCIGCHVSNYLGAKSKVRSRFNSYKRIIYIIKYTRINI